jgi:hypothetical protein
VILLLKNSANVTIEHNTSAKKATCFTTGLLDSEGEDKKEGAVKFFLFIFFSKKQPNRREQGNRG